MPIESDSTVSLFFQLTKLSTSSAAPELPHVPTAEEWTALCAMAERQTLLGVLFPTVEALPKQQRPPLPLLISWMQAAERIRKRSRRYFERTVQALDHFKSAGFDATVLKGQGIALRYPDPLLRTPGDIDLWLSGGRNKIVEYARSNGRGSKVSYINLHYDLFSDTELELHFTPSWLSSPFANARLQGFFRKQAASQFGYTMTMPDDMGELRVTTDGFNAFYLLLHIFRHLFGEGIGLRQLMDYFYTLSHIDDAAVRREAVELITRFGLNRFASAVMYVESTVFGLDEKFFLLPPDKAEGGFLLNEILRAGDFGRFDPGNSLAAETSRARRFVKSVKRNLHLASHYPIETFCDPFFRCGSFAYRKAKGWT